MTAHIRLMVNSGSGVLAAVASQLQAFGIRVRTHKLEAMSDTSALLTLEAQTNAEPDVAELTGKLSDLNVVQRVEEVSFEKAPAPAAPKIEISDDLVKRVCDAYPKIMAHIQSYEEQLAKDPQKQEKMRLLGAAVGGRFTMQQGGDPPETRNEVIETIVLPRLAAIAEASRDGDSIVVQISLFTRRMVTSMDLFSGDDENCYFLSGLIEGMIAAVPGQESVKVEETRCRANGDAACVFVPS